MALNLDVAFLLSVSIYENNHKFTPRMFGYLDLQRFYMHSQLIFNQLKVHVAINECNATYTMMCTVLSIHVHVLLDF